MSAVDKSPLCGANWDEAVAIQVTTPTSIACRVCGQGVHSAEGRVMLYCEECYGQIPVTLFARGQNEGDKGMPPQQPEPEYLEGYVDAMMEAEQR